MPATVFLAIISAICGVALHQWWKRRKATDITKYSDEDVKRGEEIIQNWYKTCVEGTYPVGTRELVLTESQVWSLSFRMDMDLAIAISKHTKTHIIYKDFNTYILRFVK